MNNKISSNSINFKSKEELHNFYSKNGYVSIKNLIPIKLLEDVQAELNNVFEEFSTFDSSPHFDSGVVYLDKNDKSKLYELHNATNKLSSLKGLSKIFGDICKKLENSDKPIFEIIGGYLIGLPKDKRLVYNFHQESNYMKGFGNIFNIHFPIFRKSSQLNGTMSVIPGTHKMGTLPFEKSRLSNDSYTDLVPKGIDEIVQSYDEIHLDLDLGDCVIFHKDLIHKSNYNQSNLCRPVGIFRFTQSLEGDWINRSPDEL